MGILDELNLGQLGASAIPIVILLYYNRDLRKDRDAAIKVAEAEREYSREQVILSQDLALKTISVMERLEAGFVLLREGLK